MHTPETALNALATLHVLVEHHSDIPEHLGHNRNYRIPLSRHSTTGLLPDPLTLSTGHYGRLGPQPTPETLQALYDWLPTTTDTDTLLRDHYPQPLDGLPWVDETCRRVFDYDWESFCHKHRDDKTSQTFTVAVLAECAADILNDNPELKTRLETYASFTDTELTQHLRYAQPWERLYGVWARTYAGTLANYNTKLEHLRRTLPNEVARVLAAALQAQSGDTTGTVLMLDALAALVEHTKARTCVSALQIHQIGSFTVEKLTNTSDVPPLIEYTPGSPCIGGVVWLLLHNAGAVPHPSHLIELCRYSSEVPLIYTLGMYRHTPNTPVLQLTHEICDAADTLRGKATADKALLRTTAGTEFIHHYTYQIQTPLDTRRPTVLHDLIDTSSRLLYDCVALLLGFPLEGDYKADILGKLSRLSTVNLHTVAEFLTAGDTAVLARLRLDPAVPAIATTDVQTEEHSK